MQVHVNFVNQNYAVSFLCDFAEQVRIQNRHTINDVRSYSQYALGSVAQTMQRKNFRLAISKCLLYFNILCFSVVVNFYVLKFFAVDNIFLAVCNGSSHGLEFGDRLFSFNHDHTRKPIPHNFEMKDTGS